MTALLEHERTVLPPEEGLDELCELLEGAEAESITLSGSSGEDLVLPRKVVEGLSKVVKAMTQGRAVLIAPIHQALTTQEAADLLGISRPSLVKLLEAGEIPHERPRSHRRVRLVDVLSYQQRRSAQRRESLDRMVEIAETSGMYEHTAAPIRTR